MPDISLANLNGIPGVNQAAMTQANLNDCGAYAIIAAVGAFGVFPVVANLAYADPGPQAVNVNGATTAEDTYPQLAATVYGVTGILNNAAAMPVVPELLAAGNVYSAPAAMAKVAMDLGRQVLVRAQAAGFIALSALYPGERARCVAVVGGANVDTNAGAYAPPGPLATHVVCVSTGGGLHWLGQGSNGEFYDPADGTLNNRLEPVNTNDRMGPYTFTGLWLEIR
ncbi:MAG: hypothetical protein OEV73_04600 [Desulfobulbaceae bacterium]|nr:hypothetical protein [Desulfobulbaceae bacterium]